MNKHGNDTTKVKLLFMFQMQLTEFENKIKQEWNKRIFNDLKLISYKQ